jgi:hypothetical protein
MPFDSDRLSPVAAIDSSLSVVHSAVVPIPHRGACNLEPLSGLFHLLQLSFSRFKHLQKLENSRTYQSIKLCKVKTN